MNISDAITFAKSLVDNPIFKPIPGMHYLLMTTDGRMRGRGVIDEIHPEWGPMDNGAPINGWVPDFRDDTTFDICVGLVMRSQ
jgi:hypothetical protein